MIWILIFLSYSFFGFLLEVAFARLTGNPKRDRKCQYFLPLCPVYGLGALCILALPAAVRNNLWLLFFAGGAAATAAEYVAALFYERVISVPFWDYSHLPANLGGRVCLLFSGFWGLLALGLVHGVHPWIAPVLAGVPAPAVLLWAAAALADACYSARLLRAAGHTDCLRWNISLRIRPAPAP